MMSPIDASVDVDDDESGERDERYEKDVGGERGERGDRDDGDDGDEILGDTFLGLEDLDEAVKRRRLSQEKSITTGMDSLKEPTSLRSDDVLRPIETRDEDEMDLEIENETLLNLSKSPKADSLAKPHDDIPLDSPLNTVRSDLTSGTGAGSVLSFDGDEVGRPGEVECGRPEKFSSLNFNPTPSLTNGVYKIADKFDEGDEIEDNPYLTLEDEEKQR
eukprot:GHVN01053099.1.p1 GENE.GHVN01053099.1~~GHVN01053099.1.p1  ORF type:complete len:218 (-),score=91.23 GHVN01053099.1:100-753(-)